MKVLVTASTGFVGRHLVQVLGHSGYRVVCFHRATSDVSVLPAGVDRRVGDVRDVDSLRMAVEGSDAIIHLVAIIRERGATFEEVNYRGVRNLLEACQDAKPSFLHLGALGTREDSASPYARSKAMGEGLVAGSGLRYTILRPSLILGAGGDFTRRFISLVKRYRQVPVVGSGEALIQPIHVSDVVKAVLAALERTAGGGAWSLVGPERVSWNDFVLKTADAMGLRRSIRHVPASLVRVVSGLSSVFRGEQLVTRDELTLMRENIVGDIEEFRELVGEEPMGLDRCLRASVDLY